MTSACCSGQALLRQVMLVISELKGKCLGFYLFIYYFLPSALFFDTFSCVVCFLKLVMRLHVTV